VKKSSFCTLKYTKVFPLEINPSARSIVIPNFLRWFIANGSDFVYLLNCYLLFAHYMNGLIGNRIRIRYSTVAMRVLFEE
jgi:hypothetical protein